MDNGTKRFFDKVHVDAATGCHNWTGAKKVWGYGRLHRRGRMRSAHRMAWEIANGPIPDGHFVLHRCDNRACVNPEHLFLGSQRDSVCDAREKKPAGDQEAATLPAERPGRFEFALEPAVRAGLDELARDIGSTPSALLRLGAHWVLRGKDYLRTGRRPPERAA